MYERLDKLREEVRRCEKRRDDADERLKSAKAKLREAESSQILSDVGALKLSPEEVARVLQLAAAGQLPIPGVAVSNTVESGNRSVTLEENSYTENDKAEENDKDENY